MGFEITNYFEKVVIDTVTHRFANDETLSHAELEDIACLALNEMPAKYVRHAVDVAFYMDSAERAEMTERMEKALTRAHEYVCNHRRTGE